MLRPLLVPAHELLLLRLNKHFCLVKDYKRSKFVTLLNRLNFYGKHSQAGVALFNKLPAFIRVKPNVKQFKNSLRTTFVV